MEDLEHIEAFEYYYALGQDRSLKKVAEKFGVPYKKVCGWSQRYKWKEKIEKRNAKIANKLAERTDDYIVKQRDKAVKEIKSSLRLVEKLIKNAKKKFKRGELNVNAIHEVRQLVDSQERLIRTLFYLLGEPTERTEQKITLQQVLEDVNSKKASDQEKQLLNDFLQRYSRDAIYQRYTQN